MQHLRISATAGVIASCGDILLQWKEGRQNGKPLTPSDWNSGQTARLVSYRLWHAPLIDACWRFFDARLPFAGSMRGVALRVLSDQCILMPPSLVVFFLSQGKLEGLSNDECVDRVRNQCIPAMTICFPFWCAVHTVTFAAFSPAYRMAWAQCAAVVWNALVSEQNQIARRRELENRTAASSA